MYRYLHQGVEVEEKVGAMAKVVEVGMVAVIMEGLEEATEED